ncbi:MAG: cation diffusion facilitator family transporter [Actinomycetota bacterium]
MDLRKFAWLSIGAAVVTIALKTAAWVMTGSVGLLSDAAESVVNLVAAVVALIALTVAASPATDRYTYGRTKAEYFSAAIEGMMIFVAASVILVSAVERFINPRPLENVGIGLLVSMVAAAVNGAVALVLLRAGRRYRSLTLAADGHHLMTDVVTSVGVVVGVGLVWLTGWDRLDPIVAFAVGVNIIVTGIRLLTESMRGLLDVTIPEEENARITEILRRHTTEQTGFHGLQTRVSGRERYASVHVLVPDDWTVHRGHAFIDEVERELREAVPGLIVLTHLEPISDPASYEDIPLGHVEIHLAGSMDHDTSEAPPRGETGTG